MARLRWYALAISSLLCGCGHGAGEHGIAPDLATGADAGDGSGADLGVGDDLAVGAADLAIGGGGDLAIGGGGDLATAGAGDLAMMTGPRDLAGLDLALAGSAPVPISPTTRPDTGCPLVAVGAGGTFSMWTQSSSVVGAGGAVTLDSWAFSPANGGATAHGNLSTGGFLDSTCNGSLVPLGSSFLYNSPSDGAFIFDGTKLTRIVGRGSSAIPSGSYALVVPGPYSFSNTLVVYDATATQISSLNLIGQYLLGAGADGNGNFGVAYLTLSSTWPSNSTATLSFRSYGAGTWSNPETVTTQFAPMSNYTFRELGVAYGAGTWAVSWITTGGSTVPLTVALRGSGGAWTSSGAFTITGSASLAGAYVLSGNSSTLAVGALGSPSTFASVYSAGSWTTTPLDSSFANTVYPLVSTGSGWVMAWGVDSAAARVSIFNGASWTTPYAVGHQPSLAAGAAGVAVASTTTAHASQVAIYANGAWSSTTLSSARSTGASVAATAGGFVASYVEPGAIATRLWSPSAWAAPSSLPCNLESGAAISVNLGEAPNGHALAVWTQYDAAQVILYASEFDGAQWGTAVQVANLGYPAFPPTPLVVAGPTGFTLGWSDGYSGYVAPWAGASTTATKLPSGSASPMLAWSGATLMAMWADTSGVESATSSDGVTWSAPTNVEPSPWVPLGFVANGAGFFETSYNNQTGQSRARAFQGGAWSAPSAAMVAKNASCAVAAANASFVAACSSGTALDAQWWNGSAFTHVPVTTAAVTNWALASDGTNYRVEYDGHETIFSSGAWSAPATEAALSGLPLLGLVSLGYTWELLTQQNQVLERAAVVGSDLFGAPTAVESSTATIGSSVLAAGPTRADAVWTKLTAGVLLAPVAVARTGL